VTAEAHAAGRVGGTVGAAEPANAVLEVADADRQVLAAEGDGREDAGAEARVAAHDDRDVLDDAGDLVGLAAPLKRRTTALITHETQPWPVGSMCWTGLLPA
jgi:hypothetical protein